MTSVTDSSHPSRGRDSQQAAKQPDELARGESLRTDPTRVGSLGRWKKKAKPLPLQLGVVFCGRYELMRLIGTGGFSDVYLAKDRQLDRRVAVKRSFEVAVDTQPALEEAKTIASLDHPAIVRIYDVIRDPQHGLLIVMQFVNGSTLRSVLEHQRMSVWRAVETAKRIAYAVAHAHSRGIVHRDIKPANILFDAAENPLLSDFGLAWKAAEGRGQANTCGTPRYMSPEQICGDSEGFDTRSDIFSLGVVLYQMLTGTLPFDGPDEAAIRQATLSAEPVPVSHLNADVPFELNRVCMRAIRRNAKARFATMLEMAEALAEIQQHLEQLTDSVEHAPPPLIPAQKLSSSPRTTKPLRRQWATPAGNRLPLVPRGLQPYGPSDAKVFWELAAGPRDSEGRPELITFWQQWIESPSSVHHHRVGVLHGPFGSGKTSLVQAGICPQLSDDICTITIECRPGNLHGRIAHAITTQLSLAGAEPSLVELLIRLRVEETVESEHRKVVLILDQFESWAKSASPTQLQQLAVALRQCDSENLQTLIVTRDSQWSKVSQLLALADEPLLANANSRGMELLTRQRAYDILESFGRYHGTLVTAFEPLSDPQRAFLDSAVKELGSRHGGRVIPLQLAVFAQVAELSHWNPEVLNDPRGLEQLYVSFFEHHFDSEQAPAKNRRVSDVAAELLKQLLPGLDQTITEKLVSSAELDRVLGERFEPEQIHRATSILCEDLKVIVQVGADELQQNSQLDADYENEQKHQTSISGDDVGYRIANEFMLEPIRYWIEQVNHGTRHGRALAKLHELSGMWSRRGEARFLPSRLELLQFRQAVKQHRLDEPQQRYLAAANRLHRRRSLMLLAVATLILGLFATAIAERRRTIVAERNSLNVLIDRLLNDDVRRLPRTIEALANSPLRFSVISRAQEFTDSVNMSSRTRSRLLLASLEPEEIDRVYELLGDYPAQLGSYVIGLAQQNPHGREVLRELIRWPDPVSKRRAAITLAYCGDVQAIESLLNVDAQSEQTQLLLNEALSWRDGPSMWCHLLESKPIEVRYHAACMLGSYPRSVLQSQLPSIDIPLREMLNSPSAKLHSVAVWLYTLAAMPIPELDAKDAPPASRDSEWMMTPSGLTLVKLPVRNLPEIYRDADEAVASALDLRLPDHEYHVWATAVPLTENTVYDYLQSKPQHLSASLSQSAPRVASDHAAISLDVIDAVQLCNWLSQREGLAAVYHLSALSQEPFSIETRGQANGYRIPNSAELLCALVAGKNSALSVRNARRAYETSGKIYVENNRANHRPVRALFPTHYGQFVNDFDKPYLCQNPVDGRSKAASELLTTQGWLRLLPMQMGSFIGMPLDDAPKKLWKIMLVRNAP